METVYVIMYKGKANVLAYSMHFFTSKEEAIEELQEICTPEEWKAKYDIVPLVHRPKI